MEESSEKRRERLRAMRMGAEGAAAPSPSPPLPHLSNPLLGPPPFASPAIDSSPPSSRFDYYTDPMSAFSGSKRKGPFPRYNSGVSSSPISRPPPPSPSSGGPGNYQMAAPHSPMQQFQVNQFSNQSSQMHYPPGGAWRSPVQFESPYSGYRGSPVGSSAFYHQSGGSSGPHLPSYTSRGGYSSPNFGSSGRGRSPMNYSGRGNYHSNHETQYRSPSPGWSQGRRGPGCSSVRPDFRQPSYDKSMVADPWQNLKPVVGNILVPLAGPDFWLPKSLTAKKAKVSESGIESNSQSSLAEYLALSLEEAVNDVTDV
ncbi:hypothetical protein J5N97_018948 [Dioscorea zingiberensis]|uniref:Uncharacterized protein n=1 Tax=Dioscorea zingiberensis TaxID=325984 RepID=A0A9D5CDP1_9LILI|nr:hypothetical protein J5N97_018948 [Dioscorea zingiberensis]